MKDISEQDIKLRHSASHIMTAAVQMLYGKDNVRLGVGPWTQEGFYQDFEIVDNSITESDLKKIEKKMRWIINKDMPIKKQVVDEQTARQIHANDPYKQELIDEIVKNGEEISVYYIGESLDKALSAQLCEGPHVGSTGELKAFKLTKLAGAYWRGDEKNPMLTRIYGIAFQDETQLQNYLDKLEEAKKRDHRKLGKQLDLFTFSPLVGSGLPLWTPKGTLMRSLIVEKIQKLQSKFDYQNVTIPHITKKDLYEKSGHWEKFKDELFKTQSQDGTEFALKPMNCPHHTQIYASSPRSYKQLPIRYAETTMVYRDEQSGELLGLSRVRSITQDDAHIFCTPEQIETEISNIVEVIKEFYTSLGMFEEGKFYVSLSVRDKSQPEKYLGTPENWDKAETILEQIIQKYNFPYEKMEGEAAFYGPKIDFIFKDALERDWQLATAQLDFVMPERFELTYIDKDGQKKTPVMIHRAIAGSLERFMSVMIEHFAGEFPFWLSPEQIRILPVGEAQFDFAQSVAEQLKLLGFRVTTDTSGDTISKKIRNVKLDKVPYYIVIGDKEQTSNKFTLQSRDSQDTPELTLEQISQTLSKLN